MKKKFLLYIILMSSSILIFSQNIELNKEIIWQNKSNRAYFRNVEYSEDLPFYTESINLSSLNINSNNVDVQIIVTNSSDTSITNINLIPANIKPVSSVYYGRDQLYLNIRFLPLFKNKGQIKKVLKFKIIITPLRSEQRLSTPTYADNSVLSSGKWVKIAVFKRGVYKLSHSDLKSLGFQEPNSVRVFGNDAGELPYWNKNKTPDDLVENSIYKGEDYILFYAEGPEKWIYNNDDKYFDISKNPYSDTAFYFLTDKNTNFNNAIRAQSQASGNSTADISNYTYCDFYEKDLINLAHTGRIWFGEDFRYNTVQDYNFDIKNYVAEQNAGRIVISIAVRSSLSSTFTYSFAGLSKTMKFEAAYGSYYERYAKHKTGIYGFTPQNNDLKVNLKFNKPTSSSNAWLDKIIINVKKKLIYEEQMNFRSLENIGVGKISKFILNSNNKDIKIWNVTDPTQPTNIDFSKNGNDLSFKVSTDSLKEFVAFDISDCLTPHFDTKNIIIVANQNLHHADPNTDMLIITPPEFIEQANSLAEIHKSHDGLNVKTVLLPDIYNEFGCGAYGAVPIRNYIRMVYEKTNHKLKYVLLYGDGTYNNKGENTSFNPNFVPTYQMYNSLNYGSISSTTDDFFALLDENEGEYSGKLDVAVGRFPVKTPAEAEVMVEKLELYYSQESYGDWRNIVTIVADDNDSPDNFINDAERLADRLDTNYQFINVKKIYLDSYQQQSSANGEEYPDAVSDLNNIINSGSLIINYLGHGGPEALASERIITRNTVKTWHNKNRLSLFITGTCEFSRFDDSGQGKDKTSAGETVVLNPNGGAIVMITTARVTFGSSNLTFIGSAYKYLLKNSYTIGESYYLAKNDINNGYAILFFTLMGDPAVRLQYAEEQVNVDKINNIQIKNQTDTLKALDKISVEGFIKDKNNNILNDFNGVLTMTLFDKKQYLKSLNNDNNGALNYWNQYNKLFRGRASVTNGYFNIDFIIPKDIIYKFGKPKFSFYASSNNKQATGYFDDIILGGISKNIEEDNIPPEIKLYMNDSNFVSGSITNTDPKIYAILSDANGINTSSASIGHDIIATLDNNTNKRYSLNEYYLSDIDNYQRGIISYNLFKLKSGHHSLSLKAWDTHNNSAERSIDFVVSDSDDLTIENLLNYPNPFTTNTNFYFEHNKPGIYLDVLLQIFTVSGKLVKTIHQPMTTAGFRSEPINWNGLDDFGDKIGSGVYIYRVKIKIPSGKVVEKYEKILILK